MDAQGRKIDGVASTTKTMVSKDYFMVHPAFMDGTKTGFENGEWDTELPGIWVGKYETSGTTTQLKVQPGVSSLINQNLGPAYTAGLQYAEELESHILKNSEWGAVAYLTESKYGRNGTEVSINNNGPTYYTGGGKENSYITNTNQSSTANVYGIYDLSGNTYEYIASGYQNQSSIETLNGSNKYGTVYSQTSINMAYKYGDATYETSEWHEDRIGGPIDSYYPFFFRGGNPNDSSNLDDEGIFNFIYGNSWQHR